MKIGSSQDSGVTLLEYAMLALLIGVVCAVAVGFLGTETCQAFSKVGTGFNTGS